VTFLIVGCSQESGSESSGSGGSTAATSLSVQAVTSDLEVKAGYGLKTVIEVEVDENINDVPVVISAVNSSYENSSLYVDSSFIDVLEKGSHSYELNITVPRDLEVGDYTLIATVDPDDLYGKWDDEKQFFEGSVPVHVASHGRDELLISDVPDEVDDDSEEASASAHKASLTSGANTITIEADDENISISATLAITPTLTTLESTDVNITACLDIGSECIDLPLWSSEGNGTLSTVLQLKEMVQGSETIVSIDTMLPYSEVSKVVNEILSKLLTAPLADPLLESAVKLSFSYNGEVKRYDIDRNFILSPELLSQVSIPVISLAPQKSARASSSCAPKVLEYSKKYARSKYGKRFGAGVYAKGRASLDGDGLHSHVYASVTAKALGRKDRFLKLVFDANALPGSFEETGYDLDVEVLKIVVFSKSDTLASRYGLETPTVTEEEENAIKLKIDNNETNLSKAALMKQKLYKKANNRIKTYGGSSATAVGYAKTWDIGKKKGFTQQFIVGIVPVTVTSGAQATVGFESDIALQGITVLEGTFKPIAKIGAYVQGGVGVVGYSAGVEADLWLVTETLKNSVTASLDMQEDSEGAYIVSLDGHLKEKIYNYFRGPNGKLYLYARYTVPRYCKSFGVRYICGTKSRTKRKYLGQFRTSTSSRKILDRQQTLFSIPLDDCN